MEMKICCHSCHKYITPTLPWEWTLGDIFLSLVPFHFSCFTFSFSCFMLFFSYFLLLISCFMFHIFVFMFHVFLFIFHVICSMFHVSLFCFHVSCYLFNIFNDEFTSVERLLLPGHYSHQILHKKYVFKFTVSDQII